MSQPPMTGKSNCVAPYSPNFKGVIERLFATVNEQFITRLTQVTPSDQQKEKPIATPRRAHELGKMVIHDSNTSRLKALDLRELVDVVITERH